MSSFYDLASLVMIPSGKKAGKVYSQKPLTTDGQLDFTRASTATRIGSDGNIEKTRTNLVLQSNQFDTTWTIVNSAVLTSGQADKDGGTDAWLIASNGTANAHISQSVTAGVATLSVYAKAGTLNWLRLYVDISGANASVWFDLANGALGTSFNSIEHKIESIGSGWYRCSLIVPNGGTIVRINPSVADIDVSQTTGNIYIQDAQLEQGLVATDYIPTTSAAVSVGSVDNMPRLNYTPGSATSCPSLLLEPQRTNLIPHSEYFQDSGWQMFRAVLTVNNAISPDGTLNAYKLSEDAQTGSHMFRKQTLTVQDGVFYTGSIFAKKAELTSITLNSNSQSRWAAGATFDLSNGTVTSGTGQIVNYGNDWYRCSITGEGIVDTGQAGVEFLTSTGVGQNGKGIFVYGAQFEEGSYATSYIPTFGATVTRVIDGCTKTGVSGLIGQTEGTIFMDANYKADNGEDQTIIINEPGFNDYVFIQMNSSNTLEAGIIVNTNQIARIGQTKTSGRYKCAFAYKDNDFAFYVNGVQIGTDTSGSMSGFTVANINFNHNNKGYSIHDTLLFKTRLSNTQLAELTSIDS